MTPFRFAAVCLAALGACRARQLPIKAAPVLPCSSANGETIFTGTTKTVCFVLPAREYRITIYPGGGGGSK